MHVAARQPSAGTCSSDLHSTLLNATGPTSERHYPPSSKSWWPIPAQMPTILHQADIYIKQNKRRAQPGALAPKAPPYGDHRGPEQTETEIKAQKSMQSILYSPNNRDKQADSIRFGALRKSSLIIKHSLGAWPSLNKSLSLETGLCWT